MSRLYSFRSFLYILFSFTAIFALPATGAAQVGLGFNGTTQYVTTGITPSNSPLNTPTFTVETWFRRNGTGTTVSTGTGGIAAAIPLVTKGTSEAETAPADINYFLGINTAGNVLCADFEEAQTGSTPGLNHPISGTTAIVNSTWYHAAATYNGTKWQLFLNGNLEAELVVSQPPNAAVLSPFAMATSIRSNGTTIQGYFNGVLDEVRLWNYARSQAEVQAAMNSEVISGTGLLGRWGLNENTGTTAGNSVVANPSGTLINSPTWTTGATALAPPATPPAAPTGLAVAVSSAYQLNLSWTDNSNNETGFQVWRSDDGGAIFTQYATTAANAVSFQDTAVNSSTQYYYRVRAANASGTSAYTSDAYATTPAEGSTAFQFGASNAYVTFGQATSTLGASSPIPSSRRGWPRRTPARPT
jgi:hypothetical protein